MRNRDLMLFRTIRRVRNLLSHADFTSNNYELESYLRGLKWYFYLINTSYCSFSHWGGVIVFLNLGGTYME